MAIKIPAPDTTMSGTLLGNATPVNKEWYSPPPPAAVAWAKWRNMTTVELWQAIALSCGIEPTYNPQGTDHAFDERMAVALSHMRAGGNLPAVAINAERPHCSLVRLADVAKLAARCAPPWALPAEFPAASVNELLPVSSEAPENAGRAVEANTTRMVAWQGAVLEAWGSVTQKYGNKTTARHVIAWCRTHGPRDVFPNDQPEFRDTMIWIDREGLHHPIKLKTVSTVMADWRKAGKIPAKG